MRNWCTSFMLDNVTREAELRVIATVMGSSGALKKRFWVKGCPRRLRKAFRSALGSGRCEAEVSHGPEAVVASSQSTGNHKEADASRSI